MMGFNVSLVKRRVLGPQEVIPMFWAEVARGGGAPELKDVFRFPHHPHFL